MPQYEYPHVPSIEVRIVKCICSNMRAFSLMAVSIYLAPEMLAIVILAQRLAAQSARRKLVARRVSIKPRGIICIASCVKFVAAWYFGDEAVSCEVLDPGARRRTNGGSGG
jgi:hypothetical protein